MDIDKVVDERLTADGDFQTRAATLSDEEKVAETAKRRREILHEEVGKIDKIAKDQKVRAEKAETDLEGLKKDPRLAPKADDNKPLTYDEQFALSQKAVHPEDVPEVIKASKLLGKSIAETLADPIFVPVLASRVEKRASANAADNGGGRGGAGAKSDADILAAASRGEIPAAGTPEAEQLFRARREQKKNRR